MRERHPLLFPLTLVVIINGLYTIFYEIDLAKIENTGSFDRNTKDEEPSFLFYHNLSCPFEWSKYSCSHQGQLERANSSLSYAIGHTGILHDAFVNGLRPNQKVLIVGDSLMRQIFITLACGFFNNHHETVNDYRIDWQDHWPCHGTAYCVPGGPHSGFNVGSVIFQNRAELHYLPHSGSLSFEIGIFNRFIQEVQANGTVSLGANTALKPNTWLSSNDVLVANVGIHVDTKDRIGTISQLGMLLQQSPKAPRFLYITTPTQHFPTHDGQYVNGLNGISCLNKVEENPRHRVETSELKLGVNVDELVIYDDFDLGFFHIGHGGNDSTGKLDCSHYCLPGVPDVIGAKTLFKIQEVNDRVLS
jgi:hypothetical protein